MKSGSFGREIRGFCANFTDFHELAEKMGKSGDLTTDDQNNTREAHSRASRITRIFQKETKKMDQASLAEGA